MKKSLWLLGLSLLVASCGRESSYLYVPVVQPPAPAVHNDNLFRKAYKVKELVTNPIDLLWVIDNSASMDDDIRNVSDNAERFVNTFIQVKGANWKMGVISSDKDQAPFLGFNKPFDNKTIDPVGLFRSSLTQVVKGGTGVDESTFVPVTRALDNHPTFWRKNAQLAIITMTDEEEQNYSMNPQGFQKALKAFPSASSAPVLAYAVLGTREDNCGEFRYAGSRYEEYLTLFNGKKFNLCDKKFGDQLVAIGKDIVKRFEKLRIPLQDFPETETLKVIYDGKEIPGGVDKAWVYLQDVNAVAFNDLSFAPHDNAEVEVMYEKAAKTTEVKP